MGKQSELIQLSQVQSYGAHKFNIDGLLKSVRDQVQSNLISQFGLGPLFNNFQDGGGVDTIHNVRNEVYSSSEVKEDLHKKTSGYSKEIANSNRKGSENYKKINAMQAEAKKSGKLIDPNTGDRIGINEKTDLDHRVALKEIFEDKGRALSGMDVDEAANTKTNLKLTDRSINRSMKDANKSDYAKDLPRKREIWEKERQAVKNNTTISPEKKRAKLANIENKMRADAEAIEKSDRQARLAYEIHVNSKYYLSSNFLGATVKNASRQAGIQGLKSVAGAVVYQLSDLLFDVLMPIVKSWNSCESMKDRVEDFKTRLYKSFDTLKQRIVLVKDLLLAGLSGGFLSAIANTLINAFLTTGKNFARIINDTFVSLWQAVKLLTTKTEVPLSVRIKEAFKLITTALIAAGGFMLGEAVSASLAGTPFAPIADIIGTGVAAVMTGMATALVVYLFDHFAEVVDGVKSIIKTMAKGMTVTSDQLKADYEQAIIRIDGIYRDVLEEIYVQYDHLNKLADLAFDLGLKPAKQFYASQEYADEVGVDRDRVLRSREDVKKYFKN